jgi:hypothetical protein
VQGQVCSRRKPGDFSEVVSLKTLGGAGTLFPVLGVLNVYPFIHSYVADHFQYLASLAIIVPEPFGRGLSGAAREQPATGGELLH